MNFSLPVLYFNDSFLNILQPDITQQPKTEPVPHAP